jgi:hypothetical protein
MCLKPVIVATQRADIRKIMVQIQSGKEFVRPDLKKNPTTHTDTQKCAGGVGQGVGPEFKPQYRKNT